MLLFRVALAATLSCSCLFHPAGVVGQTVATWRPQALPTALQTAGADSTARPGPTRIGLAHVAVTMGIIGLTTLVDRPIRDEFQRHRTDGKDDLARIFKDMGEPDIYAPLPLALMATGLLSGDDRITRAGGRITAALLTSGAVVNILKPVPGRRRPRFAQDAYDFTPLSGSFAWPSGHSAMAFALATSVSDEVRFVPVTVALYSAAVVTGWSRMNDNRHWMTDVLGGMMIGITSAKVMNGRWRFLGIGGPRFLQEPRAGEAHDSTDHGAVRLPRDKRLLGIGNGRLLLEPSQAGVQFDF